MAEYLRRMARYNAWANKRLFSQLATMPAGIIAEDRGAPFDSMLGILNHIFVVDILWLGRFAKSKACFPISPLGYIPPPSSLHDTLFEDHEMEAFCAARERLDALILAFSKIWDAQILNASIHYTDMEGHARKEQLGRLLQHFFNHQTHHRGQVTALLSQAGVKPVSLDIVLMLQEESETNRAG